MKLKAAFFEDISETTEHTGRAGVPEALQRGRNLRLVAHVIKKYQQTGYDMDDLLSVGTIGLIKAVNTFNVEKGSRLATYAAKCVENAMLT